MIIVMFQDAREEIIISVVTLNNINTREKPNPYIFRQIVLNPYIFCHLGKTIVICTPERESTRENNRKATNNDRGTRVFVFGG